MMLYMSSKVFQDVFLVNESDQVILKSQYVLVSTRIRRRNAEIKNIISAMNTLYPDTHVYSALTKTDFVDRYREQLDSNKALLAVLIKGAIEEKYNIIFMCTHNEMKAFKYLKHLADYIYLEFGYPVYEYSLFASGASRIIKYNQEKVLKYCNKILKDAEKKQFELNMKSEQGRGRIIEGYKKMKKSKLEKILKKRDLYEEGMSKKDMLDTLEVFL